MPSSVDLRGNAGVIVKLDGALICEPNIWLQKAMLLHEISQKTPIGRAPRKKLARNTQGPSALHFRPHTVCPAVSYGRPLPLVGIGAFSPGCCSVARQLTKF